MRVLRHCSIILGLLLVASQAHAGIVITGTRLIYPGEQKDVTLNIRNTGKSPSLVKAWVDDGKGMPGVAAGKRSPFLVTPPVSRIDADKGLLLRVALLDRTLPGDRESVFWLNVLEIPSGGAPGKAAAPATGNSGRLQLAFRSQIKLLYRPPALKGSAAEAVQGLKWRLVDERGGKALRVSNAAPYSVSLAHLRLASGYTSDDLALVPAKGSASIPLPTSARLQAGSRIHFAWINDFGARVEAQASAE